jgi:hypothetical protein
LFDNVEAIPASIGVIISALVAERTITFSYSRSDTIFEIDRLPLLPSPRASLDECQTHSSASPCSAAASMAQRIAFSSSGPRSFR